MSRTKLKIKGRTSQGLIMTCTAIILILFASWSAFASAKISSAEPLPPAIAKFVKDSDQNCERLGRCKLDEQSIFASFYMNSIDSSLAAPNKYLIRGWFSFNWLPTAYPTLRLENLQLGCRSLSSSCSFSGWKSAFNSRSGERRIWGARFELELEERNTYSNYPFDQHWIKIVIQPNGAMSNKFISNIDTDSFNIQLASGLFQGFDRSFDIDYATIGRKSNSYLINSVVPARAELENEAADQELDAPPLQSNQDTDAGMGDGGESQIVQSDQLNGYLTTSISFHLVRRTPAALLMIVTPLLLILLTTIIGFHWRESSPASRFGASGLLSAVSLYFASRAFRPAVDYIVFSDIWFLLDYILIVVNSGLLAWLFRFYKHRGELKRDGKAVPPGWKAENMLTYWSTFSLISIILILFVISQKMLQPPSIPIGFLAGDSGPEGFGTSLVRVIEKNELLPSTYLLPISPQPARRES